MSFKMGWIKNLKWVNEYHKKQCRRVLWRLRAAMKKVVKNGSKKRVKFEYDPSSYALNFDDGCFDMKEKIIAAALNTQTDDFVYNRSSTLVYIIYVIY
ncbi:hypothetical protein AQUCO_09200010v1 [Aquilegia coerulea]|uniref:Uncharacterized protein n=1 Tax=Aquilegia coerulea TaxID=218851 RepID=A0A2G5C5C6_AQUCA|nr:hypothetical protein AQUCO_09200010v1 [Aquilegia coerulea]